MTRRIAPVETIVEDHLMGSVQVVEEILAPEANPAIVVVYA
jgi:hypothetical protein